MADKFNAKDYNDEAKKVDALHQQNMKFIEEEMNSISRIFDFKMRINKNEELLNELINARNEKQDIYLKALKSGKSIHWKTKKYIEDNIKAHDKEIKTLERKLKIYKAINVAGKMFKAGFDHGFLMEADAAIKSISRELGLSTASAAMMRSNIEASAGFAARLGASVSDLAKMQLAFTNETGRARAFSSQMLEDITKIGMGTGLGVEKAGKLAGQFELMGIYGKSTLDYAQNILDTSERMGVNATKVFDNISSDFKQLQKYTFRGGVMAMAKMAAHAEKFKYDMGSMLDSAESARTLEGAVKLAAQLQVMGGEFARTNPFELLFLSRNDPDKFAEKINGMTRGIATFRKNSEGVFEKFISPVDIDRLEKVGQALGMQRGELAEQAKRLAEINRMRQQMLGGGYTKDQSKLIENAAEFDSTTGRFTVQIGNHVKDISKLTQDELTLLQSRSKSLEDRAKEAQTFDQALLATINELKSALLPILNGVQSIMNTVRPYVEKFTGFINTLTNSNKGAMAVAGMIYLGAKAWGGISSKLAEFTKDITYRKLRDWGGGSNKGSAASSMFRGSAQQRGASGIAMRNAGIGKGIANAGVGAAGLGIGAGIGVAAKGISELADAIKEVDVEKLQQMNITLGLVGGTMAAILIPSMWALAPAGWAAAPAIAAIGLAAVGIGAGIGIAAAGIGYMSEGLSKLVESSKGADWGLAKVAAGIVAINGAMALGGATALFGGAGLAVLAGTLRTISSHSDDLAKVGDSFKNISTVMTGDMTNIKELESLIKSISSLSSDNSSTFSKLANSLNKPLQVEFADKEISLITNLDVKVDGYSVAKSTNKYTNRINFNKKILGRV